MELAIKIKLALYEAKTENDTIHQEKEQSDTNEIEMTDTPDIQEKEQSVVKLNRVFTKKIHDLRRSGQMLYNID